MANRSAIARSDDRGVPPSAPTLTRTGNPSIQSNGFVELIGLPGAGKSTIVANLAARDDLGQLLAPLDPGGLAVLAGAWRLYRLGLPRAPVAMCRFLCNPDGRWLLAKLGLRCAAVARRGAGRGRILVDSGVLQPFVSFLAEYRRSTQARPPIRALLPALPLPSGLIYVRVSAEVALQRYRRRQAETGRRPEAKVGRAGFEQAHAFCEWIVACYREQGQPVVVIDATRDMDDAALASCARDIKAASAQSQGDRA